MKHFIYIFILFFSGFALAQEQFVVYFDSDKHELASSENKKLTDWIKSHTKDKIVAINGYTDEDGSSAYNDSLAQKRVNQIISLVKDKVALRSDFKSRSYGKNFEQDKNKSKNRRVTIYYIEEKDLARENEILGIKEEVIVVEKPIDTTTVIIPENATLEEKFEKTKVGSTLKINNINFHLNTFAIMNESRPVLYELLDIMRKNQRLVIQIQGHVCCNMNLEDKKSLKLSNERAKAIKMFLVANGIPSMRVSFEGFGSSKPIFAIPEKDENERIANRRVEILIVSK